MATPKVDHRLAVPIDAQRRADLGIVARAFEIGGEGVADGLEARGDETVDDHAGALKPPASSRRCSEMTAAGAASSGRHHLCSQPKAPAMAWATAVRSTSRT